MNKITETMLRGLNGTNGMDLWIRFIFDVMMHPPCFRSPHITIPIRFCMS